MKRKIKQSAPTAKRHQGSPEPDPFSRSQTITHQFPTGFILFCKLANVTPANLIADLADNLAFGSWKRKGRDVIKERLLDYFIEHGYGQEIYTTEEIREMAAELDAVGRLFPIGDIRMIESYESWREDYYKYWFNKWKEAKSRSLL